MWRKKKKYLFSLCEQIKFMKKLLLHYSVLTILFTFLKNFFLRDFTFLTPKKFKLQEKNIKLNIVSIQDLPDNYKVDPTKGKN